MPLVLVTSEKGRIGAGFVGEYFAVLLSLVYKGQQGRFSSFGDLGRLFDNVKNGRKRNVDGEVLASRDRF